MSKNKNVVQLAWGVALILAGLGVFYRIPYVMSRIETIEQYSAISSFIKFCFYVMGIILIGGGVKKLHGYWRMNGKSDSA